MRLVIDGRIILPRMTGAGRYVLELARRLRGMTDDLTVDVLLLPETRVTGVPEALAAAGVTVHFVDAQLRSLRQWWLVPRVLERLRPDLFHYPFVNLPFVRCPSVVTIYDLNMVRDARYFDRLRPVKRFLADRLTRSSLRRCRAAITISHATHALLQEHYPESAAKLRTIPLGVDPVAWAAAGDERRVEPPRPWLGRQYVLYVGVDRPHKNLARLVRAFALFRSAQGWSRGTGAYLRLAGVGPGSAEVQEHVSLLDLEQDVLLEGEIDEVALRRAYWGATLLAYVSTSEGFGVPILEAFAAGVPVVAAQASSPPEVAGDAAVYAPPHDDAGIAAAIARVWNDENLRRGMIERGRRRIELFSWDATARATLAVYYEAMR
jgi:glycosyltransferase involved in cell wall biosynthesis